LFRHKITPMPWRCPACQTEIRYEGAAPQPKQVYRCHVCRLELVVDEDAGVLTVAPFPGDRRAEDRQR
jgi:hypothetical protein